MVERHRDESEPFQSAQSGGLWEQRRKRGSARDGRAVMTFATRQSALEGAGSLLRLGNRGLWSRFARDRALGLQDVHALWSLLTHPLLVGLARAGADLGWWAQRRCGGIEQRDGGGSRRSVLLRKVGEGNFTHLRTLGCAQAGGL
jgi:hypothetical protein